jgi:hypothetical protein
MYSSLYDKVVVQSLQPSCPVNLADMMRACVVGWKRDGEWPPKSNYPAPAPMLAQASAAELLAMRQRKAQQARQNQKQQQQAQARKSVGNTTAAVQGGASTSRRMSFVGFLGGGGGGSGGNKGVEKTAVQEAKDKEGREGKENGSGLRHSQSHSHSDEGAGSSGKTLFRRSLQKVLSLGQHGHQGHQQGHNAGANGNTSVPAPPSTKEVTAAG